MASNLNGPHLIFFRSNHILLATSVTSMLLADSRIFFIEANGYICNANTKKRLSAKTEIMRQNSHKKKKKCWNKNRFLACGTHFTRKSCFSSNANEIEMFMLTKLMHDLWMSLLQFQLMTICLIIFIINPHGWLYNKLLFSIIQLQWFKNESNQKLDSRNKTINGIRSAMVGPLEKRKMCKISLNSLMKWRAFILFWHLTI